MDPEDLPNFLEGLNTTKESRVDVLRVVFPQGVVTESTLDDGGIERELAEVNETVVKPLIGTPEAVPASRSFVLL